MTHYIEEKKIIRGENGNADEEEHDDRIKPFSKQNIPKKS